jgi:hypothetical protein
MPADGPENAPTSTPISHPIDPPPPPPLTTTTFEPTDYIGPPPSKKQRRGIDESKRRSLRRYKHNNPGALHKELRTWFKTIYSHTISQSIVSESLGPRFLHLDVNTQKNYKLSSQRTSKPDFPDLEAALFDWQLKMQKKKAPITREVLKAKASEI